MVVPLRCVAPRPAPHTPRRSAACRRCCPPGPPCETRPRPTCSRAWSPPRPARRFGAARPPSLGCPVQRAGSLSPPPLTVLAWLHRCVVALHCCVVAAPLHRCTVTMLQHRCTVAPVQGKGLYELYGTSEGLATMIKPHQHEGTHRAFTGYSQGTHGVLTGYSRGTHWALTARCTHWVLSGYSQGALSGGGGGFRHQACKIESVGIADNCVERAL
jgi:hypothetical protein